MARAVSETKYLGQAIQLLHGISYMVERGHDSTEAILTRIKEARKLLERLETQATLGVHKNPALVVYNPPVKAPVVNGRRGGSYPVRLAAVISDRVLEIKYWHPDAGDDDGYVHPVETPARLYAGFGHQDVRCLLIVGKDGQPLWASDAEVQSGRVG